MKYRYILLALVALLFGTATPGMSQQAWWADGSPEAIVAPATLQPDLSCTSNLDSSGNYIQRASCPKAGCTSNGCGGPKPLQRVPNHYGKAKWGSYCDTHDYCYCGQSKDGSVSYCTLNKQDCDKALSDGMAASCWKAYPSSSTKDTAHRNACLGIANRYFEALTILPLSEDLYVTGRQQGCGCVGNPNDMCDPSSAAYNADSGNCGIGRMTNIPAGYSVPYGCYGPTSDTCQWGYMDGVNPPTEFPRPPACYCTPSADGARCFGGFSCGYIPTCNDTVNSTDCGLNAKCVAVTTNNLSVCNAYMNTLFPRPAGLCMAYCQ